MHLLSEIYSKSPDYLGHHKLHIITNVALFGSFTKTSSSTIFIAAFLTRSTFVIQVPIITIHTAELTDCKEVGQSALGLE